MVDEIKVPSMPKIQLVINFNPENYKIDVSGPLENKLLCIGLLELAKEAIGKTPSKPLPHKVLNFIRHKRS